MASHKITRFCRVCGNQFNTYKKSQTLCSWDCRAKSKVTRITFICRECGNEFTREPNQAKSGRIYFCGRECSFKHGKPFEKKFWAKVSKTETCWLWLGTPNNKGYGATRFKGRRALAHRVSFEIHNYPIPKGLEVLHSCDTPACVNPAHLNLGTHRSNMTDCVQKDRQCRGERNGHAKFTDESVKEARRLRSTGATYLELEKHFNISRQTISRAVRGETWKHINP